MLAANMHLYKSSALMQLSQNGLVPFSRNFSTNNNAKGTLHHWIARLTRMFDRNLKWDALNRLGRRTKNLFFCTVLENKLVQSMLNDFTRAIRRRDMFFSATALSVYNWDKNTIPDHHIEEHVHDVDYITKLTLETLTCEACKLRLKFDQKVPDINYCVCAAGKAPHSDVDGWKPFLERQNTLVWRKEHECYKGLYAYKMYGKLDAVTPMDFLRVQLDTQFRKQWDNSATELKIIEEFQEDNSDLVYWEMQWPRPFANRDYVFQRKLTFVPNKKTCVISSVAISHPAIPVNKSLHRVTEYWSFMVVKPYTNFHEPGTEFVLTYFDNPGLSIPSSVSTWVAMTGLPSFVSKLQDAAGRVAELPGPEPALMRCLRQWTGTWHENVLTAEEEQISGLLPSHGDNREPARIEESTLTITIQPETSAENQTTEETNQETPEDCVRPVPPTPVPVSSDATTQFLTSPVFA